MSREVPAEVWRSDPSAVVRAAVADATQWCERRYDPPTKRATVTALGSLRGTPCTVATADVVTVVISWLSRDFPDVARVWL
jgi:hypothetical protein